MPKQFHGVLYDLLFLRCAYDGMARLWAGSSHATLSEAMAAHAVTATGAPWQAVVELTADETAALRATDVGEGWEIWAVMSNKENP